MTVYALVIYSLMSFNVTVVSHTPSLAQCQANGDHMRARMMNTIQYSCLPSVVGNTNGSRD